MLSVEVGLVESGGAEHVKYPIGAPYQDQLNQDVLEPAAGMEE